MIARVLNNNECRITQKYKALTHKGVDMVKYYSETCSITAHTDGKVVWVQTGQSHNIGAKGNLSYGNAVKLKHANGYYTLYALMSFVNVKLNPSLNADSKK